MKRILVTLMILGMMTSMFANGTNEKSEAKTTDSESAKTIVKFWSFHSGGEGTYLENAVKMFNATHSDIEIEHQVLSQSDYITVSIPTAYANGEAPDIFYVEPSTFTKYASKGMLADLTPYYSEELKADFLPSALQAATYRGKILALPMEMETLGLFYNADMLREAGITPPTTWDELYEDAKKLTTDDRYGLILPVENTGYTLFNWWPFMWMNGADIFTADRSKTTIDTPQMAAVLDYWGRFYHEGLAPSSLQIGPWDIGNIGTGIAAMQVGGTYMINAAESTYADVDIRVVPLPAPEGKQSITVAGGQKLAINAESKYKDAAAKFIFWLYGDTDDIGMASKWVTEAKFAYPARYSVIEANSDIYQKGLRKTFTDFYDSAIPEPSYSAEVTDAVGNMLQDVMFGTSDGASAAKKTQQIVQDFSGK